MEQSPGYPHSPWSSSSPAFHAPRLSARWIPCPLPCLPIFSCVTGHAGPLSHDRSWTLNLFCSVHTFPPSCLNSHPCPTDWTRVVPCPPASDRESLMITKQGPAIGALQPCSCVSPGNLPMHRPTKWTKAWHLIVKPSEELRAA